MSSKTNSKTRYVRCPKCLNVLPEPPEVLLYKCGGCNATLQAKKRNKSTVDTTTQKQLDDDPSGKRKVDQVSGDQEVGSSSNQPAGINLNSTYESGQNNDDVDDLQTANKDEDEANEAENGSIDASSHSVIEYLYGKQKKKQLSDDHEGSSSPNQQLPVNSMDEPHEKIHNDPRSSTELSGNEDPESSPEATGHSRIDQEQEQFQKRDQDRYQDTGKKEENATVDAKSIRLEGVAGKQKIEQVSDNNEACISSYQPLMVSSINGKDYHDDQDQVFLSCRHDTEFEESGSEFEEAIAKTRTVRDFDGGSKSSFKSLIAEKLLDTRQKKAVYLDEDDILSEDGSADLHHRRRYDRISSIETMETERFSDPNYYRYVGNRYRFNRRNQTRPLKTVREPENPKLERIQLLKMVRELQDELERTKISNPHQVSLYNNPVRYGRYGQRMAVSGEATAGDRRRDSGSCHHCYPQDRRFSAQLPRQHVCCNGPRYGPSPYYSPCFSTLTSPIRTHSEPEFSATDDYNHLNRNDVTRPYHSPKKNRYVRPIANGSPWITCYRCSKLIELPQSFLVFNKKYHTLKCGACFKVLDFTVSDGTHVSRYYPEETIAAPPSSEVEDYDALNRSRAGPVSCSDVSFQKSYSTETGSFELSSSKNSGRRKMTSEIEVEPRPNGSPLHRLMGYASPSKVIRGG